MGEKDVVSVRKKRGRRFYSLGETLMDRRNEATTGRMNRNAQPVFEQRHGTLIADEGLHDRLSTLAF